MNEIEKLLSQILRNKNEKEYLSIIENFPLLKQYDENMQETENKFCTLKQKEIDKIIAYLKQFIQ